MTQPTASKSNHFRALLKQQLPLLMLIIIFLGGFSLRLIDLKEEPLDFNLVRQLRDATIARSIYYQLLPGADPDTVQLAKHLADQVEVLELPILEAVMAGFYLVFGELPWLVRVFNALCWAVAGFALYSIGQRYFRRWALAGALAFFFFLPFGVMVSRSFQPDAWLGMWVVLSMWSMIRFLETETWKSAVTAGLVGGITLLVKPVAVYYVGLIYLAAVLAHFGFGRFWRKGKVWLIVGLALVPVSIYLLAIPGRGSEHLALWTFGMAGRLLTFQFYQDWLLMIKRLSGLAFAAAAAAGVMIAPRRLRALLIGGWLGYIAYGLSNPYQYGTHDYYHLMIVPLMALSLMAAFDALAEKLEAQPVLWQAAFAGLLTVGMLIGALDVKKDVDERDYSAEPAAWAAIGEQIPADADLVTLATDYGLRLRYYGWRGTSAFWPSTLDFAVFESAGKGGADTANRFRTIIEGMDYFVVLSDEEWQAQAELREILTNGFAVHAQGDGYIIFDLRAPIQ